MLAERGEGHEFECPFMGGRQNHVGCRAVRVCSQPVHCGYAPPVAGLEPGEAILRHGCDEVVADATLVFKERGRDHRADCVAPAILGAGAAAPVPIETGEGVDTTRLKLSSQHIAIGHRSSIALDAAVLRAPPRSEMDARVKGWSGDFVVGWSWWWVAGVGRPA